MNTEYDPTRKSQPDDNRQKEAEEAKNDQQKSDPPLTEIKGVTHPEEYEEPEVEDEPEKQD